MGTGLLEAGRPQWAESRHGGQAAAGSALIHVLAVALLFATGGSLLDRAPLRNRHKAGLTGLAPYIVKLAAPPGRAGGGGGGGDRSLLPASQGRLPRAALRQFVPPAAVPNNTEPKLAMEPSVILSAELKLPDVNVPQFGLPSAPPGPASNGPGSGGGIGSGRRGGVGSGDGPGVGPGEGGGFGGGSNRLGAGDTRASVLHMVEPDFSDEARRAKLSGVVVVKLVVDERGLPRDIEVVRPLGLGLDEEAVKAVREWRFRPAVRNGRAIASAAIIEVKFHLL